MIRRSLRLLLSSLAIAVFMVTSNPGLVYGLSPEQLKLFNSGVYYYDIDPGMRCGPGTAASSTPTLASGSSLYILGDSITAGTEPKYKELFDAKGIQTYINGSSGRAWTQGGSSQTPQGSTKRGSEAVDDDKEHIAAADGIIIALGSNGGERANPIDEIIAKVRSYTRDNTVPIWWINTMWSGAASGQTRTNLESFNLGDFNNKLQQKHRTNLWVIDWYRAVDQSGNPTVMPGNDPQSLLSDGLHPNGSGQNKLAELVINAVGGTGTGGSSSTSVVTEGGTYSANVWGSIKTLQPEWIPILDRAAQRFQIDPAILAALLSIETGWDSPASFATNPRRNSATATGPFQFIDSTAVEFMPAPDQWATNTGANYTSKIIKQLNNGSDREPDGSYVADGNKDGKVDRATPEDAALMAAAYMKSLGVGATTPLGEQGDYRVPHRASAEQMTVRIFGAYYNQGPNWSAPNATTKEQVNALARGNNDVAHYMDQMWEVTKAGRESGVYGNSYGSVDAACSGVSQPASGEAAKYIPDCGVNGGNAKIACIAINELSGIPYSNPQRAKPDDPNPAFLDCSALINMAVYRAFGTRLEICSIEFKTNRNYQLIDVRDIQPGDIVGKGTVCGEDGNGVTGHVAIVVSYDSATKKLITVETGSEKYPSGLRGIGGENGHNVGLQVDGNGDYAWAVRYVGQK